MNQIVCIASTAQKFTLSTEIAENIVIGQLQSRFKASVCNLLLNYKFDEVYREPLGERRCSNPFRRAALYTYITQSINQFVEFVLQICLIIYKAQVDGRQHSRGHIKIALLEIGTVAVTWSLYLLTDIKR